VYLDHDSLVAVDEAIALTNSADPRTGQELLADSQALFDFLDERHITGTRTGSKAELQSVHRLRARLREIFELAAADREDETVEAVNALISRSNPMPRLVRHDDQPLHLHYTSVDVPLDRFLGAAMGIALAIVIRDGGVDRLRLCPAPSCGRALVDLTKNKSRRFCDTQCANRVHAAAHRQRSSPDRS
jgi:predicted RNA-binding Zn ribbon-like protein